MYVIGNGRSQRKTMFQMTNPYANYCADALQKTEMKLDYENELFLKKFHLMQDPLQKNLADTLVTAEPPVKVKKQSLETPAMPPQQQSDDVRPESALTGITNFFSGVFSMLSGAMFRPKSPVNYYDCFDADGRQGAPIWRGANADVEDKNGLAADESSSNGASPTFTDMNKCKTTVSSCEDKLKQVKCILTPNQVKQPSVWLRKRPKKVFVDPGSVEDSFEDAFSPEDFVSISSEPYIEYHSAPQFESKTLCETDAPKTKLEAPNTKLASPNTEHVTEVKSVNTNNDVKNEINVLNKEEDAPGPEMVITKVENNKLELINNLQSSIKELKLADCSKPEPEIKELKANESSDKNDSPKENNSAECEQDKDTVITSCEDKLTKLKELLQEKRTKNTKIIEPIPAPVSELKLAKTIPIAKPVDKHYKNPHRMLDKRRKMKMKRSIQEDMASANDIDAESSLDNTPSTPSTVTSSETSLGDYFDELKGRFRSASATESEDSFQIVFNDSPRHRRPSDCESEDSFIVFEDDCYTSNDVFGDSDSDSDISDSGCSTMTCKLSHTLSRTVSNLTDDTLYESSDEVDCAKVDLSEAKGLLIDDHKKRLRKDRPAKKVTFSSDPPQVKVMRVWAFAARQARAGHWERYALDRDRFRRRIDDVDMAVSWVLKPQHRSRIMFQRFMPWWNKEKRRELAERRQREAKRKEEERAEKERIAEEQKRAEEEYKQSKIDLNNVSYDIELDKDSIDEKEVPDNKEIEVDLNVVSEGSKNYVDEIVGNETGAKNDETAKNESDVSDKIDVNNKMTGEIDNTGKVQENVAKT